MTPDTSSGPCAASAPLRAEQSQATGRRVRAGSIFVRDLEPYRNRLDREARHRLLTLAERQEKRTRQERRQERRRNGALGDVGLRVLKALVLNCTDHRTGVCCPSYERIAEAAGVSRRSVANGINRLVDAGLLRTVRRMIRVVDNRGIVVTKQDTNLYVFTLPTQADVDRWQARASQREARQSPCSGPRARRARVPFAGSTTFSRPEPDGLAAALARFAQAVAGGAHAA